MPPRVERGLDRAYDSLLSVRQISSLVRFQAAPITVDITGTAYLMMLRWRIFTAIFLRTDCRALRTVLLHPKTSSLKKQVKAAGEG